MLRILRRLAVALTVLLPLAAVTPSWAKPPNVVVMVIDDLGRNDLGCYGSTYYRTTRIDALAQQGMRWLDAYAACPVCSPTRAALLTGQYPARLNLTDWLPGRPDLPDQLLLRPELLQHLPLEQQTLAELLQQAGYATAHIGKWHLGGAGYGPEQQGFELNIAGDAAGSPRSYFAPYRGRDGTLMPGLGEAPDGEYLTDRLTAEAVQFITAHQEEPFFLYLSHYAVHTPLAAKADLVAQYAPQPPGQQNNPVYAAMIESVDQSVGSILDKLAELQLDERTLVLFTSDNGGLSTVEGARTPATVNSPLREGKGFLYEGGIRVPLLVRWPGVVPSNTTSNVPLSSIDILPTVLELCQVPLPHPVDGVSMASVLRGEDAPERPSLYWHYPHYSNQAKQPGAAVRRGEWKLIEFFETGRRELYNVVSDPGEIHNRAADEPALVTQLAEELAQWQASVHARRMQPNPDYVPHPQDEQGRIVLPASRARVHGMQLRYEALPHKNTLGFWTHPDDWASWEFTVTEPGTFEVTVLQGCGAGQGGSEATVSVGDQTLAFVVEDTGHFQNFVPRAIGRIECPAAGRYTLEIRALSKPGVAVMDVREVQLQRLQ